MSLILRRNGYEVLQAADGASALQLVETSNLDLIVLDLDLPDISGYELCRRFKSNPAWAQVPVVICSAHCEEEIIEATAQAGAVAFITKPFDTKKILNCVRAAIAQNTEVLFDPMTQYDAKPTAGSPSARLW